MGLDGLENYRCTPVPSFQVGKLRPREGRGLPPFIWEAELEAYILGTFVSLCSWGSDGGGEHGGRRPVKYLGQ